MAKYNPHINQLSDGNFEVTPAGHKMLRRFFTNPKGRVSAVKPSMDPRKAALAMARLSRFPGSLEEVFLLEFTGPTGDAYFKELAKRVLGAYGDDSVKQLYYPQVQFTKVSNLTTKQLEWFRIGTGYSEKSSRYQRFDQRDQSSGQWPYFKPTFDGHEQLQIAYGYAMDAIFERYAKMVSGIEEYLQKTTSPVDVSPKAKSDWQRAIRPQACNAVRAVLPASLLSNVRMTSSAQTLEYAVQRFLVSPLPEMQSLGRELISELNKIAPEFFVRTEDEHGQAFMQTLVRRHEGMSRVVAGYEMQWVRKGPMVTLVAADNESLLEMVSVATMSHSVLSYSDRMLWVSDLSDQELESILRDYVGSPTDRRQKPGRAFERFHVWWEIVGRLRGVS